METHDCLFCDEKFYAKDKLLYENVHWRVVYDGFPISVGHCLIIPKKHVGSIFDIGFSILTLYNALKEAKRILDAKYSPQGYNLGINDGFYAGQTIPHLHIHLIPRYKDDGGLPCGVRNIFPKEIADYRHKKS